MGNDPQHGFGTCILGQRAKRKRDRKGCGQKVAAFHPVDHVDVSLRF